MTHVKTTHLIGRVAPIEPAIGTGGHSKCVAATATDNREGTSRISERGKYRRLPWGGTSTNVGNGRVMARSLGDSGRGAYALVATWYGMSAMVAEWGQSAAVTFFVARAPDNGARGVSSARLVMLGPSLVVALCGVGLSSHLADGDPGLTWAYILAFSMPLATALAGAHLFAAQSLSIGAWNVIRIVQPVAYLVFVVTVGLTGHITVMLATACLASSLVAQMICAWAFGSRRHLTGGSPTRKDVAWLALFGVRQMGSTIPAGLSSSLDKVVLANFVSAAVIGHYAVAFTMISVAGTFGAAISAVSYPRFASLPPSAPGRIRLEIRALGGAGVSAAVLGGTLAGVSPWLIPFVYGSQFTESVHLVWWFFPGTVLTSLALVGAAILRGRGQPGRVAMAQGDRRWRQVLLLTQLVPIWGAVGAALSVAGASAATQARCLAFGYDRPPRTSGHQHER